MLTLLRMGNDWNFVLTGYGHRWRMHRKMFHQEFNSGAVTAFHDIQLKYARYVPLLFLGNHSICNVFKRFTSNATRYAERLCTSFNTYGSSGNDGGTKRLDFPLSV